MLKFKDLEGIVFNTDNIIIKDLKGDVIATFKEDDYIDDSICEEEVSSVGYANNTAIITLNKYAKKHPTTVTLKKMLEDSMDEDWLIHNLVYDYNMIVVDVLFTKEDLTEKVNKLLYKDNMKSYEEAICLIILLEEYCKHPDTPNLIYYSKSKKTYAILKTEEDFIKMVDAEIGVDDSLDNMFANEMVENELCGPAFYSNGELSENARVVYEDVADDYFDGDMEALNKAVAEREGK